MFYLFSHFKLKHAQQVLSKSLFKTLLAQKNIYLPNITTKKHYYVTKRTTKYELNKEISFCCSFFLFKAYQIFERYIYLDLISLWETCYGTHSLVG